MNSKLVVVTGATGTQGGSVLHALVASGRYKVRAISRQPGSPAAQQLVDQGVEVVQAALDDPASLVKAFEGAYAVYGMTPLGDATETQQGKNIVDACKARKVPLLVWSSLPSASETSGGKYPNVTHYDRKAAVDQYIKEVEQPAVTIYTGFFSENIVKHHAMTQNSDGSYEVSFLISSEAAVPHTWVKPDLGAGVLAMIDHWDNAEVRAELQKQQPIHICSYRISGTQMAESVSRVTGKPARYAGVRATGSGDLPEMFQYLDDGLLYPEETIPSPILMELGVKFHTFDDFVRDATTE